MPFHYLCSSSPPCPHHIKSPLDVPSDAGKVPSYLAISHPVRVVSEVIEQARTAP